MALKKIFVCCFCLVCGIPTVFAQKQLTGKATYYSDKLHGKKMSNGEKYHRDSMTCAYKKYPFGTLLKVRNSLNGKEVVVRVTDRGPFSKRYVIDLSKAAARELEFIQKGFCQVEITRISSNRIPFRSEDTKELIEPHLEYLDIATYPIPIWQQEMLQERKPQPTRIKKLKIDKNRIQPVCGIKLR